MTTPDDERARTGRRAAGGPPPMALPVAQPVAQQPSAVPVGAAGSWAVQSPGFPAPTDQVGPGPEPATQPGYVPPMPSPMPSPMPPTPMPPIPTPQTPTDGDADDDLFLTDDDFTRPRRTNRLTRMIIVALVGVIGFGGGVLAQKSHDAGLTASPGPSAFRSRASGQGGSGQGGFAPGGGSAPAGFGQGGQAGQSGSSTDSALPAVVGTVTAVSGTRLTVTNFAGKAVAVTIAPTTTVTLVGATALTTGLTASVVGPKAADGSVTATAITVRRPTN